MCCGPICSDYETVGEIPAVPSTVAVYEPVKVEFGVPSVLRPPAEVILMPPHLTVTTPLLCVYLAQPLSC